MRDDVFNHKMFASVNGRSESRLACRYGGFWQVERRLQAATVQSVVSARAFGSSLTSNTFFFVLINAYLLAPTAQEEEHPLLF